MAKVKQVVIKEVDLKKLRNKAGLSVRELAELSGVHFSNISKYENGLVMEEETWKKIKKVLDRHTK